MRNHYIHEEDEDKHSLTDKIIMGIAFLGSAVYIAQFAGCFEQAPQKVDSKAVPRDNIVYMDIDGDGKDESAVRSQKGVLREIKYDNNGNPYIEHRAFAFEVDMEKPYHGQKQEALSARSR